MNARRCPVPSCTEKVPPEGIFCLEHYWRLPQQTTGFLFRLRAAALRCEDADEQRETLGRLDEYTAQAVRQISETSPTSSPVTRAGRQTSSLPAGTPQLKWPAGIILRFGGSRTHGGRHG